MLSFDEIVGNKPIKTQLTIAAEASRVHNRAVPHMLLGGSPGCGKTTCSKAMADFLSIPFIQADATNLRTAQDLLEIIGKLPLEGYDNRGNIIAEIKPAILFFDEIHNMPLKGQEHLGIAMEEWKLAITMGSGKNKKNQLLWVPRFCVVGATTMTGKLSKPLRDRFKLSFNFKTYSLDESTNIVFLHAAKKKVSISMQAALLIACRGRGTPRILVRYLETAIDHMTVLNKEEITGELVESMFSVMGIDDSGLLEKDVFLLKFLYDNQNEPVGLDSLGIYLQESPLTIAKEIEPYLIQRGLLIRSSRGRLITEKGTAYLQETGVVEEETEDSNLLNKLMLE